MPAHLARSAVAPEFALLGLGCVVFWADRSAGGGESSDEIPACGALAQGLARPLKRAQQLTAECSNEIVSQFSLNLDSVVQVQVPMAVFGDGRGHNTGGRVDQVTYGLLPAVQSRFVSVNRCHDIFCPGGPVSPVRSILGLISSGSQNASRTWSVPA